jgi:hypothetical protein
MPNRTSVALALLSTLLAGSLAAQAQPEPPGPAPLAPAPGQPSCSVGRAGALSELGCEARRALGKLPAGAIVVAAPLGSDTKPRAGAELSARILSVISGALGAKAETEPATLSRARTLAAASGTLVHLVPEIARGELRITLDVYPVPRNFWDRVRDPEPNPVAHAFVSRHLDAELRTFFPPVPLVASRIDKAVTTEQSPVALACGDVDGDGALELVLVGRARVQLGRVRAGRFAPLVTAAWTQLSPLSRAPLREPIASAVVESGRWVDIGLSDRLDAVRLDARFASLGTLGHRVPWPGGGCAKIQGTSIRPEIERCQPEDEAPRTARMDRVADALAGATLVDRQGRLRTVRASRAFNESSALVRDDAGRRARLDGVGAELAVGDVDGDGLPDILSSIDTLDPGGDALVIHTWRDDGSLVERTRVAVPQGVRALAVCPAEGAGLSPIAVATSGELWVLR